MNILQFERTAELFSGYGLCLTEEQYGLMDTYIGMLLETNRSMNLTRITEPEEITCKHLLDSAMLLRYVQMPDTAADVGTGAGFPGTVLKIMSPSTEMTLIDSLNKRISFLKEVSAATLPMNCVHMRAEEAGRKMRESFGLCTARAVAAFDVLCEYCLPLTHTGGIFAAYKGPGEEIDTSVPKIFGGETENIFEYSLPDGEKRRLIIVRKVSPCDLKYPRRRIK
ncbi:MAG: 16S rRNA (guanine(527)-N(7))-methyltransferase RsmG [Oscillospiraceae bacterium]|nr:16S rRNA (guanine(527)-N(7))-methyltransferase RsmG [Oscillospiraceae bacterium]